MVSNLEDFESAGSAFAKGFIGAVTTSLGNLNMGDQFASSVTQIATEIFNNIAANVTASADLGQQVGSKFAEFAKNAIQGTGWSGDSAGSEFGTGINDFIRSTLQDVNMNTIAGDFMNEVSDAFKESVTKLDMAGNMNHLASEFDAGMGVFRENFFNQIDLLRGDLQSIFANMARDTTLKMLPWMALGGAILIGTPLATMYVYKKAVYNIGRPQLAQEVRKVGVWDRTTDGISRAVSSIWNSTKTGIKWSALAGAAGFTLAVAGAITSGIKNGESGYGGQVLSGLSCAMGLSSYNCDPSSGFSLISATMAMGLLRASAGVTSDFYNLVKKSIKKDEPPIFNDELQKRIDDLTTSTYNINRNGGYMQNLLLYGPGGTGKTMISKYIAKNSKMNYIMMSGGDLAQYIKRGEHVTELNKLFADARSSYSPTIIFIDECESLCGDRGKMDKSELIELVNSFLNQTGEPSKKIMVILTTNRKDDLDPAVLSRMDHKLYIGLPEQAEREKIIKLYLPKFMTSLERNELFTEEMITDIAKQTEGFTGRTIFKMLNTMSGMRAATSNNKLTINMITETVSAFVKQEANIVKKS